MLLVLLWDIILYLWICFLVVVVFFFFSRLSCLWGRILYSGIPQTPVSDQLQEYTLYIARSA